MVSVHGHTSPIASIDGKVSEENETVISKRHGADGPPHLKTLNCTVYAFELPNEHFAATADVIDYENKAFSTELDEPTTGHDVMNWST